MGVVAEKRPLRKFTAQNVQKFPLIKYLRILKMTDMYRQARKQGLRPYLSESDPITIEAMAIPISAVMGMKYVAALKPNGPVSSKESWWWKEEKTC
jgi:hypothetical protein